MVAAKLVGGTSVGKTQIEILELVGIALNVKCDTNETAAFTISSLAGYSDQIDLDRAILEIRTFHNSQRFSTRSGFRVHGRIVVQHVEGTLALVSRDISLN